jgi:ATP-dependent phosphofructokinase / diphosphate-dependent phosphofructokinase
MRIGTHDRVSFVTIPLYSGAYTVYGVESVTAGRRMALRATSSQVFAARPLRRCHFDQEKYTMRVALLTGGGDCPGLNAVIYAAVRKGIQTYGDEFIGFLNGWRGVLDNQFIPLTLESIDGIQLKGGTILHSSRTNVKKIPGGIEKVQEVLKTNKIDALIALGGDDTQSVTLFLSENGINAVGVPKTIDNDINGTDQTFGFDTAVMIATEAIDRLHTTADSHNRVIVCEVMGRDAGWIAYASGIAGGAHVVLVPEQEIDIDHVCALLKYNYDHGKHYGIVVVAEGCHLPEVGQVTGSKEVDSFGHARLSGIGEALASLIEKKTGFETRSVNLGHTQRGGVPTAYDRLLGQRYGLHAIEMVHEKKWGRIAVLRGLDVTDITIKEAIATNRRLDQRFFNVIRDLEAKV